MGVRITYFRVKNNKTLKELFNENYVQFREWYLQEEKINKDEFNEQFGNAQVKLYMRNNEILEDVHVIEKQLLDELTSEFFGTYLDLAHEQDELIELIGPSVKKERYQQSTKMVSETEDLEFIRLWDYIVNGRSIKDGTSFNSYSNNYRLGYLSTEETKLLEAKIKQSLSKSRVVDQREGLELVLDAINCLEEKQVELIIGIDMD